MRALITGSTGAFGRFLAKRLQEQRDISVFHSGRRNSCSDNYFACQFSSQEEVDNLLDLTRPDIVFHLVASYDSALSSAYPINVGAADMLLRSIDSRRRSVRTVLVGSAAEYGIVSVADNPVSEATVPAPVSIYGLTKFWQTQLGQFWAARGLDVITARIFNLDGEGLGPQLFVGKVERGIADILAGRSEHLMIGDLQSERDYIGFDLAADMLLGIARKGASGEVYNVGTGRPISMEALLKRKLKAAGLDFSVVRSNSDYSNRTGVDVSVIYAEMSKTNEVLGND
jgi:GDP-4-dehydro-6-deoxy-D-mannose reductase